MENTLFYIIIGILVFNYLLSRILDYLNLKRWENRLPGELREFYDEQKYQRAQNYNFANNKLEFISETFSFLLIIIFLIAGGFGWLNELLKAYIQHPVLLALAYFGILFIVSDLLSLPFSIYHTFVIEEKYGFNRTSPKTFIADKIKGYLLTALIGGGLGALILWLILTLQQNFWLIALLVITAFILFFNLFYTTLILPLFNKLVPLQENTLKNSIYQYAQKVDFPLTKVYVIDSSKRSTKANAFFSGFGKKKKIVLFDTLIKDHNTEELVAILAHEIGHYKKKHIPKNIAFSILQTALMLFILSLFIFNKDLSLALGAGDWELHINLIAFGILYEPLSLIIGLIMNIFSRKFEFEADRFATQTYDSESLINGLKKLSIKHLSNLKPHPAFVFFHYSHPPLLKRIEAIREAKSNKNQNSS